MVDLFGHDQGSEGEAVALKRPPLVLDGNTKPRGKHYVEPRGYVDMPGTGPEGKQCRHCKHYAHQSGVAGSFPKCGLNRARWTGGRGSDILARAPACRRFEANDA